MVSFNWVDLVLIAVFFAIVYDGQKSDLVTEILKVVGIILATFVTLHYYTQLSVLLHGKVFVVQEYKELFAYALLIGLMMLMITMIRGGWLILLGIEISPWLEKWGRIITASIRAYLLVGLLFLAFFVSNHTVAMNSARNCFLAKYAENISLDVYQGMFRSLSRFFPEETINADALILTAQNRKEARAVVAKKWLNPK